MTYIHNLPERDFYYWWVVAKKIDGEYWFYDRFSDYDKAKVCVKYSGGEMFSYNRVKAI